MTNVTEKLIEKMIYVIKDQKVMIDSDLAKLYGVETRIINRNVKRAILTVPSYFVFQLDEKELRRKSNQPEKCTNQMFKIVFERLDSYEELITPKLPDNRKKIGLRSKS